MGYKSILVTGGAGFIGSHVVRRMVNHYPGMQVVNLDKLTYAGNLANLKDVEQAGNYTFVKGDIADRKLLHSLFERYAFDGIIHLAAESHVDRSIEDPMSFIQTNILGTVTLLDACRKFWAGNLGSKRFYHISTDEVFGSLGETGKFNEQTPYDPQSPYAASKASSDHFVRSYFNTYGLPVVISNCSNNYGPNQFPEKLIPLCIHRILKGENIPVYGAGANIRDWLYVEDHASAIDLIFHRARTGETYGIGGNNEWKNIDLVRLICRIMQDKTGVDSEHLIAFVTDRAGHDRRYAMDASKLESELGWKPDIQPEEGLIRTIDWYLSNQSWLNDVTTGNYLEYYQRQYGDR